MLCFPGPQSHTSSAISDLTEWSWRDPSLSGPQFPHLENEGIGAINIEGLFRSEVCRIVMFSQGSLGVGKGVGG